MAVRPVSASSVAQLCRHGGLTCALKAGQHDDRKLIPRIQLQLAGGISHQMDHFLVHDLNDHLSRVQAVHHVLSDGAFRNGINKLPDDLEIHVCFQQRHPDLTHRGADVSLRQGAFSF